MPDRPAPDFPPGYDLARDLTTRLRAELAVYDARARDIGWQDAEAFLAAASHHFGPWVAVDYAHIYQGRTKRRRER